jgi:Na+/H+ antiporter NhaD/arsenite permease-like protein
VVSPESALRAVDFSTIVLLFSMMLLVGGLRLAGFFDWITAHVVEHLSTRALLPAVIFTAGVLSAFLVNDIVCLVMAPSVLSVTRRAGLRPLPYLLAVATASNIGSVATITGNPQNMLIGSYSGIGYRDFLAHLGPIAVAGMGVDWLILRLMFRDFVQANSIPRVSVPAAAQEPQLSNRGLVKPALVMAGVLAGFLAGLPPALVAAVGAAVLLIEHNVEPRLVYDEIDWGLLVFFVGLFVIVRGAESSGITAALLGALRFLNLHRPAAFSVVVAVFSNLVSNVPAVVLLKSLVPGFANPHTAWLMLAMASTLAGNLTITGSVANIIVVERARAEAPISFRDYFRVGLPLTVVTLVLGTAWLWWIK